MLVFLYIQLLQFNFTACIFDIVGMLNSHRLRRSNTAMISQTDLAEYDDEEDDDEDDLISGLYIETNNGKYPSMASPPDNSPLETTAEKALSSILKTNGNHKCAGISL